MQQTEMDCSGKIKLTEKGGGKKMGEEVYY